MPSILSRLASLFPSFRATYAPAVETPEERAARVLARTRADIDRHRARPRPSSEEKVPVNYHGGVAGKVWFLPFADSTTQDTPEIRAAMRLMRRDGYVKAAWEPQIHTVASEDWQVQASEPGNPESEEQADALKVAVEDYLAGGMISFVRAICAPFGSEGHSLAEPVWHVAEKGRLAKKIVCTKLAARDTDVNTGDVRLLGDEYGNVKWVEARRKSAQPTYPIDEFIFSRYLTVFDEPLGEAAFRPAYGPYWMRDTVRKLRAIHHEKRMAGMLVGTYASDDDKGALDVALAKAKTATWMSVPEGTRVEAVALSTASEPDYKSFDESLRDEVVTAIAFGTLQMLTSTATGDQRGSADVQKMVTDLGPWLLMALVTDAFNAQFAPKFIDFNYPYPAGGGYPKLTFGAVSNAELLELLQVVTGAKQLGLKPSRKHYAKALSIQEADPNDPDDALEDPNATGGFGGGGFPPPPGGGGGFGAAPADPFGGPTAAFSERVHFFGWRAVPTEKGSKWKVKAVNDATGETRYAQDALDALAAQKNEPAVTIKKTARAVNKAAGHVGRVGVATGRAGAWLVGRTGAGVNRLFGAVARAAGRDSWLGWAPDKIARLGKRVEREGARRVARADKVAAGLKTGGATGGGRTAAGVVAHEMFRRQYRENRRKHGYVGATAMALVHAGAKILGYAARKAGHVPGLGPVVAFGKEVVGTVGTPFLQAAMDAPAKALKRSKVGRALGLMKTRRDPDAALKLATKLEKGKPVAVPPEKRERVAAILSRTEKGRRVLENGFAECFAESTHLDPVAMLADLREQLDEWAAAEGLPPVDWTDEELAGALAELLEHVLDVIGGPEHESFSWSAARSRTGGAKAVGSGEHAGQVLYGEDAEAALAQARGSGGADPYGASGAGAERGDPRAHAERLSVELSKAPPLAPDAVTAHWQGPAELHDAVADLATERDPGRVKGIASGILSWIGRQAKEVGAAAVHALGSFARTMAGAAGKVLGPAAWYLGGIAAAIALMAAPVVGVATGVLPAAAAFAVAPLAAGGAWLAVRAGGRRASKVVGQNFYGYRPENYGLARASEGGGALFDRFGEGAGNLLNLAFESFSWDDWQRVEGGKWKSPGGRVLSDEVYQKLKAAR